MKYLNDNLLAKARKNHALYNKYYSTLCECIFDRSVSIVSVMHKTSAYTKSNYL